MHRGNHPFLDHRRVLVLVGRCRRIANFLELRLGEVRYGPRPAAQAREKPDPSGRGKLQRAPGLTIDRILVAQRSGSYMPGGHFLTRPSENFPSTHSAELGQKEKAEAATRAPALPPRVVLLS
jgi:hypothetical protein